MSKYNWSKAPSQMYGTPSYLIEVNGKHTGRLTNMPEDVVASLSVTYSNCPDVHVSDWYDKDMDRWLISVVGTMPDGSTVDDGLVLWAVHYLAAGVNHL